MQDDPGIELPQQPLAIPTESRVPPSFSHLRPRIVADLVPRVHLVDRLLDCKAPLVVISAPPGSGKTIGLLQWMARESRPHAWLQLEVAHNDPLVLVADLAAVLKHVAPVDHRIARWVHLPAPPLRERIIPSLKTALESAPPFILLLDDAHLLTSKVCWGIIQTLLRAFPPEAQLAIGGRSEPPLPLGRAEAEGRLAQMGSRELAFSIEETAQLLDLRGLEADEDTVAALHAATEGWAAGLSLAALACEGRCTKEWVATIDGRQRSVARYLTSEVLERQSRPMRSFLLETSILARLSDESCRAVTGRSDSGAMLARLSRENVFTYPLDEKGEWYRYHRLFGELLDEELRRRQGLKLPELHRRAATWSEQQGDLEAAIRHWLAAGEVARAGDVLVQGHFLYSSRGRAETVRRWIELFSSEQIGGHVPLAIVAGWVAEMTGNPVALREWMGIAMAASADESAMPFGGGSQRAFQVSLRAAWAPDGVTSMRRDAELAARLAAGCHPAWRAANQATLGVARWLCGSASGAQKALRSAVEDGCALNPFAEAAALGHLSLLMADQGRWKEAEAEDRRAETRLQEAELGMSAPLLVVRLAHARVLAHGGATALQVDMGAIEAEMADLRLAPWMELTSIVAMSQIALDLGDAALVERWVGRGTSLLQTWPDAGILRARLERLRKVLQERQLGASLTPMERRALEMLSTHLTNAEIAGRLLVSQNTLKTHLRGLYRKLDTHSRSDAVERARELGLLRN